MDKKIEEIYEAMANKETSFGLEYKFHKPYKYNEYVTIGTDDILTLVHKDTKYEHEFHCEGFRGSIKLPNDIFHLLKTQGHPLMIGDVFKYIDGVDYGLGYVRGTDDNEKVYEEILLLYRNKVHLPIESQSQECQDYIHSLIN